MNPELREQIRKEELNHNPHLAKDNAKLEQVVKKRIAQQKSDTI